MRAEYLAPTGIAWGKRELDWVVLAGNSGFIGANRQALGFKSAREIGAGLELPLAKSDILRVCVSVRYQFGRNVRGHALGIGRGQ